MDNNTDIGSRLRAWRKHLQMTQEEFHAKTGIPVGMIRKYEGNHNVPGGDALIAIGGTGVNLNWLLLGQGELCGRACSPATFFQDRVGLKLGGLYELLKTIKDDRRAILIDEMITRAAEVKRTCELEELVKKIASKFT